MRPVTFHLDIYQRDGDNEPVAFDVPHEPLRLLRSANCGDTLGIEYPDGTTVWLEVTTIERTPVTAEEQAEAEGATGVVTSFPGSRG